MLLMLRVCIVKELGEVDDNSDTDEKDEECMMDDDVRWLKTHNTNTRTVDTFNICTYTCYIH